MHLFKLFVFLIFLLYTNCKCQYVDSSKRLPKTIKPIRYNITVEPELNVENISLAIFYGSVVIDIISLEATNSITFHLRNINIDAESIKIVDSNETNVKYYNSTIDRGRQFFIIHLEAELRKEEHYTLTIGNYKGSLDNDQNGFYLAQYKDRHNHQRYLTLTNFELWDARRTFPCFDEPAFKAKFIINLIRPESYSSVSNEELVATVDLGNGRYQDTFRETMTMSTYLVAFAISNYSFTNRTERIRIFARSEMIEDGRADYMLLEAAKLLNALEEFTAINYTLSKMDLFAVPNDYYENGAMENWGLIVYSEQHLLYSNTYSTTADLQRCTLFSAHELAHQWFGNLVTPNWWKYMWLSEGFAAYFQYHIAAVVEPSWRLKEQYVIDYFFKSLKNDIKPSTEPMNYEQLRSQTFPSRYIAYYKASAVIRMTEHFLTYPIFRNGLRNYLQKNKFDTADPFDVYSGFQRAVNEADEDILGNLTVSDILTTWYTNIGYPCVTVERNYETGAVTLSQETYSTNNGEGNDSVWYIPITYKFNLDQSTDFSKTTADFWLTLATAVLDNNFTTNSWLLLNNQATGYYRVNYDTTNWNRLIDFLHTEEYHAIHPLNRAQLLADSFCFAESGMLPYNIPLNLSTYLVNEIDFIPLSTFIDSIKQLHSLLSLSDVYDIFQNYVKHLLSSAINHLGYEEKLNDTHIDKINRVNILTWICIFGDSQCANVGIQKLRSWKRNGSSSLSPDLESLLLCGAMHVATDDDWEFLYQQYMSSNEVLQKDRYIAALACSKNKNILTRYMDIICDVNNNAMPPSDKMAGLKSTIKTGRTSTDMVVEYLVNDSLNCSITNGLYGPGELILISRHKLEKVKVWKTKKNFKNLAIVFYTEDSLEPSEKTAISQITEWLLEYSKTNTEYSNNV